MGVVFSAVGFSRARHSAYCFFGKEVQGVAQIFVTCPALMAFPMFARALGYRRSAGEAVEVSRLTFGAF